MYIIFSETMKTCSLVCQPTQRVQEVTCLCVPLPQSELAEYVEEQIKESQSKEKLMQLRRKVQGLEVSRLWHPSVKWRGTVHICVN